MGILIGTVLNLQTALGSINILTILIHPIHDHSICFHLSVSPPIPFINVFFFLINLFINFWLHWVFVAARGLSLVTVSRGYSSLQCAGFSLRWLLLLWSTSSRRAGFSSCGTGVQQLWRVGLVAPRHVGSSWTRARTRVPCIGRRILNHCATRETHINVLQLSGYRSFTFLVKFIPRYFILFDAIINGIVFCISHSNNCQYIDMQVFCILILNASTLLN